MATDKPSVFSKKLGGLTIGQAIIFFVSILLVFTLIFSWVEAQAYKTGMRLDSNGTGSNGTGSNGTGSNGTGSNGTGSNGSSTPDGTGARGIAY
jgi:hypothetical protein